MKKHLRFWSVVMTAFYLVGMMTTMAAAATYSITGAPTSTKSVSAGGNVEVPLKAVVTGGSASGSTTKNLTVSVTAESGSSAEGITATVSPTSANSVKTGETEFKVTVSAGEGTEGNTVNVTVSWATGSPATTASFKVKVPSAASSEETAAPKFSSDSTGDGKDIGKIYDTINKGFFSGQTLKVGDAPFFKAVAEGDGVTLSKAFKPDLEGLSDLFPIEEGTIEATTGTIPSVEKDTTVNMTVTAENSGGKVSRKYTFTIFALPSFGDKANKDGVISLGSNIVWGSEKAWTFTPKTSNTTAVAVGEVTDGDGYLTANAFTKGGTENIGINFEKGAFSLAGKSWMPGAEDKGYFFADGWDGKTVSKKVKLIAYRGKANADLDLAAEENSEYAVKTEEEYTINFDGAAPKFTHTDDKYFAFKYEDYAGDATLGTEGDNYFEVIGPGTLSVAELSTAKVLLANYGLALSDGDDNDAKTGKKYYITGTPTSATKGAKLSLTAANEYTGTDKPVKGSPKLVISASTVEIAPSGIESIRGDIKDGEDVEIELTAVPGPIKWSAKNLPSGLKLTADKTDSTKATVSGTLKGATKDPLTDNDKHTWTITATNSDFKTATRELSGRAIVWAEPEFKTSTKKPLSAKTGDKGIKFSIATANPVETWKIFINNDPDGFDVSAPDFTWDGYSIQAGAGTSAGETKMLIDKTASAKKLNTLVFTGSFDRVPAENLSMKVTAVVPLKNGDAETTEVSETYEIAVTGAAPKLDKADFTFKDGGTTSGTVALKAGDPDIKWKAYIDGKVIAKLKGEKTADAVTLYESGNDGDGESTNDFGLTFEPGAASGADSAKGTLTWADADVALKKLPIVYEIWNENVNAEKHTMGKGSVTIEGTAPSWKYTYTPIEASADQNVDDKQKKLEVNVAAGAEFSGLTLTPWGSKPLAYSVKPTEKNGITAAVGADGVVTFGGTADDVKKDTAVKFSIEAKNASTGASAKAAVTVNIIPVAAPKDESGYTIESKPVTVGKNAKVAPKLAKTSKQITWAIESAKLGSGENAEDVTETLKTAYGLELDTTKGTISGTTKKATGTENPLVITMVATTPAGPSESFTVTIPIVGEKVKLAKQSKPVAFTLGDDGAATGDPTDATLKTGFSTYDANKHSITWEIDEEKAKEEALAFDVTEGNDGGITATVAAADGATLKVAKKISVPVKFNNYGTESTGKFTVTVDGATPTITADPSVTVDADSTGTVTLTIGNASGLSDKLKWKLESKPSTKGVSVSLKDNKDGSTATLTVKVAKNTTGGTGTAKISLTDSITKKKGEVSVSITASKAVVEGDGAALEAENNTSAKDEAEAKVIGEGTPTMGAQRTAENLTAAQRTFIEEQGYIIAAVLPEIEVDADGQYDFLVDLDADERVKPGDELVWFAFASKPTTDDEIADFEDVDGNEITAVPAIVEGKDYAEVVVWPWLNAGTKYAPVIAVKADAAEADAMTEEGVKEAAEEAKEEE